MTWKQLIDTLNAASLAFNDLLEHQALVYPPKGCPSTELVPITGVYTTPQGVMALSTGKSPLPTQ